MLAFEILKGVIGILISTVVIIRHVLKSDQLIVSLQLVNCCLLYIWKGLACVLVFVVPNHHVLLEELVQNIVVSLLSSIHFLVSLNCYSPQGVEELKEQQTRV